MGLIESWDDNFARFGQAVGEISNNTAKRSFIADSSLRITCYIADAHPENYANMSPLLRAFVDTSCREKGEPGLPALPSAGWDGGQCEDATYRVACVWDGDERAIATVQGQVTTVLCEQTGRNFYSIIVNEGLSNVASGGNFGVIPIDKNHEAINVTRPDGLPDDCGNPPGGEYPDSGEPDPNETNFVVDHDDGSSSAFNLVLPFSETAITFEGDNYDVVVDIDGINIEEKEPTDPDDPDDPGGSDNACLEAIERCEEAIKDLVGESFKEEEFEEKPSACTSPEDAALLEDGMLGEGVEVCEAEEVEATFLLIELTTFPRKGMAVLHKSPENTDYFAGYLNWKIVENGENYYYPSIAIRKAKNVFKKPPEVNGYSVYSINGAKMQVIELTRITESA